MPQLDILIILVQFKVFIGLFLIFYIYIMLFSLPLVNRTLLLRKYKINNIIKLFEFIKAFRFFFFMWTKFFFVNFIDKSFIILFKLININIQSKNVLTFLKN